MKKVLAFLLVMMIVLAGINVSASEESSLNSIPFDEDTFIVENAADTPQGDNGDISLSYPGQKSMTYRFPYLKFTIPEDVVTGDIAYAKMKFKIHVTNVGSSPAADNTIVVYEAPSTWSSDTLTWNNAPEKGNEVTRVTVSKSLGANSWVEIDVAEALRKHSAGDTVAFSMEFTSTCTTTFYSSENGVAANNPYVEILTSPMADVKIEFLDAENEEIELADSVETRAVVGESFKVEDIQNKIIIGNDLYKYNPNESYISGIIENGQNSFVVKYTRVGQCSYATEDMSVRYDDKSDTDTRLFVAGENSLSKRDSFVKFDLSDIEPSDIGRAVVCMTVSDTANGNTEVKLYSADSDWTETNPPSYASRPSKKELLDTKTVYHVTDRAKTIEFDVTDYIKGNTSVAAFTLCCESSSVNNIVQFYSKEATESDASAPMLCIEEACEITVKSGRGGTVSPCGTVTVGKGGEFTIEITPDKYFAADEIVIDSVGEKVDGNNVTVSVFDEAEIEVTFKVEKEFVDVCDEVLVQNGKIIDKIGFESGDITYNARVVNLEAKDKSVMMCLALYKDNILLQVKTLQQTIPMTKDNIVSYKDLSVTVKAPEDITGYALKGFVWDGGGKIVPLGKYLNSNSSEQTAKTMICDLKDNKIAAYTFTSDDAIYKSAQFFDSEFSRLGLRGSLCFPVTWMGDIARWRTLLANGNFDVSNHSRTHPGFSNLTEEKYRDEINGAQSVLKSYFPDEDVITMANPYIQTSDLADSIIAERHYAGRNGPQTDTGHNNLDPTEYEWFHLKWEWAMTGVTPQTMNSWLDAAIEDKGWLIELWHGVDGEGSRPVNSSDATAHFEYVASKLDLVWSGSFNDVTKYIRERQNATLTALEYSDERIEYIVTHTLDKDIFDYPLTMKTRVPESWTAAIVEQNGNFTEVSVTVEGEEKYIYYDIVPDGSKIVITNK